MTNAISFLASTHYTNYNPWLFAVNLTALIALAIIPKLPQVRAWSYSKLVCASVDISPASSTTRAIPGNRRIRNSYSCDADFLP